MKSTGLSVMKTMALVSLFLSLAWGLSPILIQKPVEEVQVELSEQVTIDEPKIINEAPYKKESTTDSTENTEETLEDKAKRWDKKATQFLIDNSLGLLIAISAALIISLASYLINALINYLGKIPLSVF